jgi:predicted short-subunit dehydrogenase-like oxidoreductase (DUF2520 family)
VRHHFEIGATNVPCEFREAGGLTGCVSRGDVSSQGEKPVSLGVIGSEHESPAFSIRWLVTRDSSGVQCARIQNDQ